RLARRDVLADPLRDLLPARLLPDLEGALLLAEAEAHREVEVTRVVRDLAELDGGVVHAVAQHGPDEPRLRVLRFPQQSEALAPGLLLEDAGHRLVGLAARRHVFALLRIEPQDVLAFLAVEARAALLAQGALLRQPGDHRRRLVGGGERIVPEVLLHGPDDVRQRIDADHVGRAEGAGLRPAQLRARQVVHYVVGQAELLRLVDGRQHAEDAHAVGDEVRRVLGADAALA